MGHAPLAPPRRRSAGRWRDVADDSLFRQDFSSVFGHRKAAPNKEVQSSWLRSLAEHNLDPDRVIEPEVLTPRASLSELREKALRAAA